MFEIFVSIFSITIVSVFIFKKFYPQISLLFVGIFLLAVSWLMGGELVAAQQSTGSTGFDIFKLASALMSSRLAGLGLNIMIIGGFAAYMEAVGATKALVKLCVKPLRNVRSPYVLLALVYVVGQSISLFINSAVGLGLLLMASVYPLLVSLGVTRVAAASVIATTCCLDLGPASSNALRAAELLEIDVVRYFVHGQLPVAICVTVAIAVAHFFVQRRFDKWDAASGRCSTASETPQDAELALADAGPPYYAILPMLPLFLLIVFSPMVYKDIVLDLPTAIILSITLTLFVDLLTRANIKVCFEKAKAVFEGMGNVFSSTVSLVVCAEIFATGLTRLGGITTLIQSASSLEGAGLPLMLAVMMGIMVLASVVTGSGNAAFFAFSPLLPHAAESVGIQALPLVVPVQLSASIARTMSPIVGVVIAVAGIAGVTPLDIVRRTTPVMIVALAVTVLASLVFL